MNGAVIGTLILIFMLLIKCIINLCIKARCSPDMTVAEYLIEKTYLNPNKEFSPPSSKRKQMKLARFLIKKVNVNMFMANSCTNLTMFIDCYDKAAESVSKVQKCKKAITKEPIRTYYSKYRDLGDEFQWRLCDAIKKAKETTIFEIQEKYQNSREFQEKSFSQFEDSINAARRRFSIYTAQFADDSIQEVRNMLERSSHLRFPSDLSLSSVDHMEGHDFEYWCAKLLKRNGFEQVAVTKGSGDQGVDVLALKDGVQYAIQCKCYSSDVGNTSIQEVHAGKAFYHCQVAVVMTNRYFTAGAKTLAQATGVLLWDRAKLQELIVSAAP